MNRINNNKWTRFLIFYFAELKDSMPQTEFHWDKIKFAIVSSSI